MSTKAATSDVFLPLVYFISMVEMNVCFFKFSLRLPKLILYTLHFLCVGYIQSLWKSVTAFSGLGVR